MKIPPRSAKETSKAVPPCSPAVGLLLGIMNVYAEVVREVYFRAVAAMNHSAYMPLALLGCLPP